MIKLAKSKLNNKGMTTVEILVSFILIALISSSLFTTVSNYSMKRHLESSKLAINTYKNLVTKEIQDDFIKIGVTSASVQTFKNGNADIYVADVALANHEKRRLIVSRQLTNDYFKEPSEPIRDYDDEFHIYYGKPNSSTCVMTDYNQCKSGLIESSPFPSLGYGYRQKQAGETERPDQKIQDLRITNVNFTVNNNILTIFIGFYHVDLSTKYAINIVTPINYQN